MVKKKEFKGVLAEPIEIIDCLTILVLYYEQPDRNAVLEIAHSEDFDINDISAATFADCPAMNEWFSILEEKRREKIGVLADEFGVDLTNKDGWENLAKQLASAFVPGFRVALPKRKRGAPTKFPSLYRDVQIMKDRGHSIKNACRLLAKQKNTDYFGVNPDTLEQRYYEVIQKINRIVESIATYELPQEIEGQINRIRSKYGDPTTEKDF